MKNYIKIFLLLISGLMLIACSDESSSVSTETKKDHVWKEQTDTINKAKEVEGMLLDAAENTRKTIEEQSNP
jgi:outer membrane biogenesis lipoprotein LolB